MLRAYQAKPERLRDRIAAEPSATSVVVDEVQKAPQLLDVGHSLGWERTDLLSGRLVAAHIPPPWRQKLGDGFNLEPALQIGLVPLVWEAADPKPTLAAYAALYLQEEEQAEAPVRQIGVFSRSRELINFSQGSLPNLTSSST